MSEEHENGANNAQNPQLNVPGTTNVYKVSVKYAPFNRDDPEIWFTQLEAQFQLGGISVDGTMYGHLIAALDQETIKCVRDKVLNPPARDKYNSLKSSIIERICDSAKSKLNRLLSGLQLGDKKPSQLLREMQTLADNQMNDAILQNLWLQRFPTHTQEILACMENLSLEKLAAAADKIVEVQKPAEVYGLASSSRSSEPSSSATGDLKKSIDALSRRFENFLRDHESGNDRSTSRSRSTVRTVDNKISRQRSKSRSEEQVKLHPNCWYHHKFGSKAKNCIKPCQFKSGEMSRSEN